MVTVSDNPKWHEDILKVINAFKDSFAFYYCDVIDFLNAMKTMLNYRNLVPVSDSIWSERHPRLYSKGYYAQYSPVCLCNLAVIVVWVEYKI